MAHLRKPTKKGSFETIVKRWVSGGTLHSLESLAKQYMRFGRWKGHYWRTRERPSRRQMYLLAGPLAAIPIVGLFALRSPRLALASVSAGLSLVERKGAASPRGDLRAHLWAMVSIVTVTGSWSLGAWQELLLPSKQQRGHDRHEITKSGDDERYRES